MANEFRKRNAYDHKIKTGSEISHVPIALKTKEVLIDKNESRQGFFGAAQRNFFIKLFARLI